MTFTNEGLLRHLRRQFRTPRVTVRRPEPASEFPELVVTVPDTWPSIQLAPLYDAHIGSKHHDAALFAEHLRWIARTPNVLTWNGGDAIENASKLSVGAGVYQQDFDPQNQIVQAMTQLARVRHKMLFALPGNHEDRALQMGFDVAQWIAWGLEVPYFPDYVFCTVRWRGNNFRILAHHGSGAATTAGAQRMAARKALSWAKPFDLVWTGHLHNPLVDVLYQTDFDQRTGRAVERNALVIISPSYLGFFGTYAAKKQYQPGTRGLAVVELHENGRMDVSLHARGRRL
jgi:hypothetical protein